VSDWSDLVGDTPVVQLLAKITAISPDASITLDRPLPYDLDTKWLNVSVHAWSPNAAVSETALMDELLGIVPFARVEHCQVNESFALHPHMHAALSANFVSRRL
jgi:hypothetical protein